MGKKEQNREDLNEIGRACNVDIVYVYMCECERRAGKNIAQRKEKREKRGKLPPRTYVDMRNTITTKRERGKIQFETNVEKRPMSIND